MGVLWGAMIAERPQRQATVTGLVTEMVTAVVDEAKDVVDPTARISIPMWSRNRRRTAEAAARGG